jgi:hypothetical protein
VQANLRTHAANGIAVAVAHDRDEAGSQVASPSVSSKRSNRRSVTPTITS